MIIKAGAYLSILYV